MTERVDELELLKINAILHQFKGALPLLSFSLADMSFGEADATILELRSQMLQVQGHLSELCLEDDSLLWDQMHLFTEDVVNELEQIILKLARRWLQDGSPSPRPACLHLISIDPAIELGLS